uniref:Uncharacterized protein n=1 Tax=Arundo donax TaxID=35708 RepID=A0A0A9FXR3_ARUDO
MPFPFMLAATILLFGTAMHGTHFRGFKILLCLWSVQMVCMLAMLCKLYLWSSCSDDIVASHLASFVMYYCPQRITLQPVIVISNRPLYGTDDHLPQCFNLVGDNLVVLYISFLLKSFGFWVE